MAERVLIIDADMAFGEQLQQALGRLGVDAETTITDEEGLRLAQSDGVIAACVGLMDDKGAGYGLVTRLRRKLPDLPIAMILEGDELGADRLKRHKGLRNRADQYLIRPLTLAELAEAVGQLIGQHLEAPAGQEDESIGESEGSFEGVRLFDDDELEELGAGLRLSGDSEIRLDEEDVVVESVIEELEAANTLSPEAGGVKATASTELLPALEPDFGVSMSGEITPVPVEFDEDDELIEPADSGAESGAESGPMLVMDQNIGPMDATVMQPLSPEQVATLDALAGQDDTEPPSPAVPADALVKTPTPGAIPLARDTGGGIPLARDTGGSLSGAESMAEDEVQDLMDDLNSLLDEPEDEGPSGVEGISVRAEGLGGQEHTHAESLARQNAQLSGENRRLKTQAAGLEQQLATLREELSQKRTERSSARRGDASTRRELLEAQDALNQKAREALELRTALNQKELAQLEIADELEALKEAHSALQRQAKALEARAEAGQGALDEADKDLEGLRVELSEAKVALEEALEASQEKEARLTNDIARMEQEHTITLAGVEAKAAKAAHALDQAEREAKATRERLEISLGEAEAARDALQISLDGIKASHEEATAALQADLDAHRGRGDEAEAEVIRLEEELKASQELLEEEAQSASEAQKRFDEALEAAQKGRADDAAERDARIADLLQQQREVKAELEAQERSIEGLNDEISSRDTELRRRAAVIEAYKAQVKALEGHIEALDDLRIRSLEALGAINGAWRRTQEIITMPPERPTLPALPASGLTPAPEAEIKAAEIDSEPTAALTATAEAMAEAGLTEAIAPDTVPPLPVGEDDDLEIAIEDEDVIEDAEEIVSSQES